MSDPAPRRRLRFSLLTLLVAVNVAGVLVWANARNRIASLLTEHTSRASGAYIQTEISVRGWPFTCQRTDVTRYLDFDITQDAVYFDTALYPGDFFDMHSVELSRDEGLTKRSLGSIMWIPLIYNLLVCAVLVTFLVVSIEFLVRKFRMAKRHDG